MSAVDQKVGWALSAASVSMLHVDEPLRHVNLIVRLEHEVVLGVALFDHALKIDSEVLAILARHFHFAFVGEVAKTTGANDGLTNGEVFIRRQFLRPLCFDLSVTVYAAAGLFTYAVERQNN